MTLLLALGLAGPLGFGVARAGAQELVYWDLEASSGDFVDRYGSSDVPQWAWGRVTNGPAGGYDGVSAWSTGLTHDYLNDTRNCLEIPIPDLTGAQRPVLTFWHWWAIAPGDAAVVQVDPDGSGWQVVAPVYGYPSSGGWDGRSESWQQAGVDLTPYLPAPRVCLLFVADADGAVDDGWFVDDLGVYDGDPVPPRVTALASLADTEDVEGPYAVTATAEDDVALAGVTLHYTAGAAEASVAMSSGDGTTWAGAIPGQAPDTTVTYWVEADDGGNVARMPTSGGESFRVYLPAPVDLRGPEGRVVATTATLSWSPPTSRHPVESYVLYRGETALATTTALTADVPLAGEDDTFTVRAVYDVGEGDPSEPVTIDAVVPTITGLTPADGFPGDQLRLALRGEYLLMVAGEVEASLGDAITVTGVDVRDVDLAYLDVTVAADAVPGPRPLTLRSEVGELTLSGAFLVLADDERPRLTTLTPDALRKGESATLIVGFVGELAGAPTVDLGEGVVVEAVTVSDGALSVDVAVANNAPLGEHDLTVDDGVRLYTGVALTVEDRVIDVSGGCCSTSGGHPSAWAAVGALLALRRRRA